MDTSSVIIWLKINENDDPNDGGQYISQGTGENQILVNTAKIF